MPIGIVIVLVVVVAAAAVGVVARRQGWLGQHEVFEDRLSDDGRVDAARHRANSTYPL